VLAEETGVGRESSIRNTSSAPPLRRADQVAASAMLGDAFAVDVGAVARSAIRRIIAVVSAISA
jgi:hypothetical protein